MEYKIKNRFRLIGIRKRRFCLCAVLISVLGLMLTFQAIAVSAQPAIPTTPPIEENGNGNETPEPSETTLPLPTLPPPETNDTAQPTLPPIPSEITPTPTPKVTTPAGTPTATTTPTFTPTPTPPAAIPGFGISSVVIAVMSVFVLSVVKRKRKR